MTIKTDLRPDYYEIFPSFSREIIQQRLNLFPFHHATLLGLRNIITALSLAEGVEFVKRFFKCQLSDHRAMLVEVLRRVGITARLSQAIGRVQREGFAPPEYLSFCYINHSLLFDNLSCLSAPGLVALMIERLRPSRGHQILEVGIGSGYHAACLSESLDNDCQIYGIELNHSYLEWGRSALLRAGYDRIQTLDGDGCAGWPASIEFDRIYMTNSLIRSFPPRLIEQLRDGGLIQGVRALDRKEFESEGDQSWLRKTFGNYDSYLNGDWGSYCCLVTCLKENNTLKEVDRLYDVTFTPFQHDRLAYSSEYTNPFLELSRILKSFGIVAE
jgi:protein-L-isoaspartate(D-aspartate) O-methyltransferase